jgi:hypothetical protein
MMTSYEYLAQDPSQDPRPCPDLLLAPTLCVSSRSTSLDVTVSVTARTCLLWWHVSATRTRFSDERNPPESKIAYTRPPSIWESKKSIPEAVAGSCEVRSYCERALPDGLTKPLETQPVFESVRQRNRAAQS